jgi:hypothetical protein
MFAPFCFEPEGQWITGEFFLPAVRGAARKLQMFLLDLDQLACRPAGLQCD